MKPPQDGLAPLVNIQSARPVRVRSARKDCVAALRAKNLMPPWPSLRGMLPPGKAILNPRARRWPLWKSCHSGQNLSPAAASKSKRQQMFNRGVRLRVETVPTSWTPPPFGALPAAICRARTLDRIAHDRSQGRAAIGVVEAKSGPRERAISASSRSQAWLRQAQSIWTTSTPGRLRSKPRLAVARMTFSRFTLPFGRGSSGT